MSTSLLFLPFIQKNPTQKSVKSFKERESHFHSDEITKKILMESNIELLKEIEKKKTFSLKLVKKISSLIPSNIITSILQFDVWIFFIIFIIWK